MGNIAAIIVLYHPDRRLLKRNLEALSGQVDKIFIVDNTPATDLSGSFPFPPHVSYTPLGRNEGIAAAQNAGIRKALDAHFSAILFLDQDSVAPRDMVDKLSSLSESLSEKGIKVGGVGPGHKDMITGEVYPESRTISFHNDADALEVREIISSGTLIRSDVLKDTGGMDNQLFIDGVDHEWCWRASRIHGYRFFIARDLYLLHSLGTGTRKLFGHSMATPSAQRCFYLFRNYIILSRRNYVPSGWKLTYGAKLFIKIFYYPLFNTPRLDYTANIFRGILHGLTDKNK